MRRLAIYFGAVGLVALALAGCGGGDDETTDTAAATTEAPAALSKEELIAQGDAICAEVNAAVGTVGSTSGEGQASQVAGLYSGMVERLLGLGTPSDGSAGYDELIGAAEQLAQAEGEVATAADAGEDAALVNAESEATEALAEFQSAAEAYGFEQCSEGPRAVTPGAAGGEEGSTGGVEGEVAPEAEEAAPEAVEPPVEEESAGGGAGVGGGSEGGGSGGGESGGIGPG
ncbi:MAG: hypothetical protein WD404_03310 [Solirubrobacterales bacterium]